ncbi:MAG: hypothetical protein ACXU8N_10890 [Telluria sp.]
MGVRRRSKERFKFAVSNGGDSSTGIVDSIMSGATRVSGIGFILTAVCWFYGWRFTQAYFDRVGAGWVTELLPTSSVIQHGVSPTISIAVAGYLLFDGIVRHKWTSVGFRPWAIVLLLSVFCLGLLLELFDRKAGLVVQGATMYIGLSFVGWCVVLLIWEYSKSGSKLTPNALTMLYAVLYLGLYQCPSMIGKIKADLDFQTQALPRVGVMRADPEENWRLVEIVNDKALIYSGGTPRAAARFRLVEFKELSVEDKYSSAKVVSR